MRSFDAFGNGGSWFYSFNSYLKGCNHNPPNLVAELIGISCAMNSKST